MSTAPVVLITGASRGIGAATAVLAARHGWDVAVNYSHNAQAAAEVVGKLIAERAKAAGIEAVAFDRSGFQYHGRVKALADAAREGGLKF